MKKIYILITILIITNNFLFGYFSISGHNILDNEGNQIQLRGLGLGGWLVPEGYMLHLNPGDPAGSPTTIYDRILKLIGKQKTEEFYAEYVKNYVTKEDIQQIADWGYNHIRLPFSYKFLDPDTDSPICVDDGYEIIDQCIEWCKEAGLYIILDMHCAPGGQNPGNISDSDGTARLWDEEEYQNKTVAIWKEIAQRYADEEWIIGYDLINEPVNSNANAGTQLRQLYVKIRNAIRQVDNNHILFIEGNWYATDFTSLDPIFDVKMVYSFHKYWSENDKASIQSVLSLRQKTGVPLWLGETGENSNHWFAEMRELVEANNIGWCNWTHKKVDAITSHYSAYLPQNWSMIQDGNPTEALAYFILMEFAENLKTENCRINPGVTLGYLDEEFLTTSKPVIEHNIPGTIYAVDYDLGGNGVAYLDEDYYKPYWDGDYPWNSGYGYRNDGVDIESSDDTESNGFNVGWTAAGEWLNYTANVIDQGTYNINIRVASSGGGKIQLLQNGYDITGEVNVPNTSGWQNWQTLTINNVYLSRGASEIKLKILNGSYNISKIDFELITTAVDSKSDEYSIVGENYPNPFNSKMNIPFELTQNEVVKIEVYDITGKTIRKIEQNPGIGKYKFTWQGLDNKGFEVGSGIYFFNISVGNKMFSRKAVYLK